jgi:hypothetical protein
MQKSLAVVTETSVIVGPVLVVAACSVVAVILAFWRSGGKPAHATDGLDPIPTRPSYLAPLLDYQLKNYKENLAKLDSNLRLQAFFIALTVLLIVAHKTKSLSLFNNDIPLSWLHIFVPILLIYLWLTFGFILQQVISDRILGVQLIEALARPTMNLEKRMFRDAGFIDCWFMKFVDNGGGAHDYSGLSSTHGSFYPVTLLVMVVGTLLSAVQASILTIMPIFWLRYVQGRFASLWWLSPILPLFFLLSSNIYFAYAGKNRNWFQLYMALATIPLMAFLLWLYWIHNPPCFNPGLQKVMAAWSI